MKICVFCGSSAGNNPVYAEQARSLGRLIAQNNHVLVYGGGNIGLMGILADTVLENNGKVIGIIPDFLVKKEVAHRGVSLEIVSSMHERKKRMADLADVFIMMPGGWGTLDETAEILTWKQLGLITQPVGVLNVKGFFDSLLDQFAIMVKAGFLRENNMTFLIVSDNPSQLFKQLIP